MTTIQTTDIVQLTADESRALNETYRFSEQDKRDALARRRDGSLARYVMQDEIAHHQSMIRFSNVRIADFTESLGRLEASTDFPGRDAWIRRTKEIIEDHKGDVALHWYAIEVLKA